MKEIRLPESLTAGLASGHPWVYRDHARGISEVSGSWVKVKAGSFEAYGLWDEDSAICVRIFSTKGVPDARWVHERVREAFDLRTQVRAEGVTGYRLIYGEADQLPGIVVDIYGDVAVLVAYSPSVLPLVPWVAKAVAEIACVKTVVRREKKEDRVELKVLFGAPPPESVLIFEGERKLLAELHAGQKTGLFFDHRDNRNYVGSMSAGRSVLNLFSYTGGFSIAAALGGATQVTSVDIAEPAVRASVENFRLNGLADYPHEAIAADVFDYLEKAANQRKLFGLVVCDPPSFAKSRDQLRGAERAYVRLMAAALRVVEPGGIFCAASCTSQVSPALFRHLLAEAGRKAKVRFQIQRDIGHAPDHPVLVGHEEGRYLKFIAGRALSRC